MEIMKYKSYVIPFCWPQNHATSPFFLWGGGVPSFGAICWMSLLNQFLFVTSSHPGMTNHPTGTVFFLWGASPQECWWLKTLQIDNNKTKLPNWLRPWCVMCLPFAQKSEPESTNSFRFPWQWFCGPFLPTTFWLVTWKTPNKIPRFQEGQNGAKISSCSFIVQGFSSNSPTNVLHCPRVAWIIPPTT